ncbi:MAG TPA: peptide-methionine (S)-S-oxide reductase MsrA [Planctomycetota bacterium]|nr:peptide-methionine (S)-S-oxide reductase MsrA [Planctomycetota bacterium]
MKLEKATFAAGCFWGVEAAYREVAGVTSVTSGYAGGHLENPSYDNVCSGTTGHAEAVLVEYDPDRVSYEVLLSVFWKVHDPSVGTPDGTEGKWQYRSAIFYHTPQQREAALTSKRRLETSGVTVATEVEPASTFYPAEEYHQRYYEKHPGSCPTRE